MLSDRTGPPLAVGVSAANTHDSLGLQPLVRAILAIHHEEPLYYLVHRPPDRGRVEHPLLQWLQPVVRRPPTTGWDSRPAAGRLDEAKDWYRQALTLQEELGYQPSWR